MSEVKASFPAWIDSSMLSSALACPRKFFYSYVLNLSPYDISVHLHAGGAMAAAIEQVRLSWYRDGLDYGTCILRGLDKLMEFWGDYEAPDFGKEKHKDFVNVAAAMVDYFKQYHPATDHIKPKIKADGTPATEFKFAIPLPVIHPVSGEPLFYVGRSDMVGEYNRLTAIVDEKTTYTFGQDWQRPFQMRGQFIGYCWAGQQCGLDTTVAVVRGIGIQASAIQHREAILIYPQWQIDRWYEHMVRKVQALVDTYARYAESNDPDEWLMSYGDACSSYSGCEMLDLCTSPEPENWFSSFKPRNWDPLK